MVSKDLSTTADAGISDEVLQKLLYSEQRYRALVKATAQVVWSADEHGYSTEILYWWQDITGQAHTHAAAWDWLEALHPQDREETRHAWQHALANGEVLSTTYRVRTRGGDYRHYAVHGVPIYDSNGRFLEWVGTLIDITDRKNAETERLRLLIDRQEAELRYRYLFEHVADAMVVIGEDGCYLEANSAATKLLGYSTEEIKSMRIGDLAPPSEQSTRRVLFQRTKQTGFEHGENLMQCKDGRVIVVDGTLQAMDLPTGRVYVGAWRDLTSRKAAEQKLLQNEERLRRATQISRMYAFEWYPQTDKVIRSEGSVDILGPIDDDSGNSFFTRVSSEDREQYIGALTGLTAVSDTYRIAYRFLRSDENTLWLEESGRGFFDAAGRLERVLGMTADATQRKQTEEALRVSEAQFRALANVAPSIVWTASADGTILFSNERWYAYTGLTPEQNARDWSRLVLHPDDYDRCVQLWAKALREGKEYEIEVRNRRHDGEYRWFLTRAVPIFDNDGDVIGWCGSTTDIHERKQTEQALKDADRRKDEFLAMLAHELRNPLAPIQNAVQILRELGPREPRLLWAQDVIDRQANHLSRMVDDLLDVSRITLGKVVMRREPLSLNAVVERALESSRHLIEARKHRLEVKLPAQPVYVLGDLARLAQAIANLLHNAAKYTEPNGLIRLTVVASDGHVLIRIRDNGIGIAADFLPNVFELFTQADTSLERSKGGLGIGLTLVHNLVKMHGGKVLAHSAGLNKGSEFTIYLPQFKQGDIKASPVSNIVTATISTAKKILVVDDNADSAESMAVILGLGGHSVKVASDGPSALTIAQQFLPDVVLMDIGLPGMDGFEVAVRLQSQASTRSVLLIALSGYSDQQHYQRARLAGFAHYLVKPVRHQKLQQLIAQAGSGA